MGFLSRPQAGGKRCDSPGLARVTSRGQPDADQEDLPFGLYERLITVSLKARLLRFDPAATRVSITRLDPAEAHATLARHVEEVVARALRVLPHEDRLATQAEVANQIIRRLADGPASAAQSGTDSIEIPPEQLRSIQPITGAPASDRTPVTPLVPLSASDLLVNARGEPSLAHALAREIPSADSIDLLCAFVRWHGIRVLEDQLRAHCRAGRKQRELGGTVLLFVRLRKQQDGLTMPYTFLGPVDYVSHKRERPIAFVWQLRHPIPADFFRAAKVASA